MPLDLAAPPDDPVRDRIAMGTELAKKLGTFVGDFVSIISRRRHTLALRVCPGRKTFKVIAIFSSGLH